MYAAWPARDHGSQYQPWETQATGYEGGSDYDFYTPGGPRRAAAAAASLANRMNKIGNQTNSSDLNAINSRVFVGNLNTYIVNKDQVERMFVPYGRIAGISMHKGYAFVQFTNQYDARSAVAAMDHRVICGQILDVNMVSEPKPHQAGRKRQNVVVTNNDWNQKQPAKKARTGNLRPKAVDEPDAFLCYMCKDRFTLSWDLLQHIQSSHNITLYEEAPADSKDFAEDQGMDELNGEDSQAS